MSVTIFFLTLFLVSLFTPESIIPTLVGGLATLGLTSWLKKQTGLYGVGALILTFVISFAVSALALAISAYLSGKEITLEWVLQSGAQIFTLATVVYKLIWSDKPATI